MDVLLLLAFVIIAAIQSSKFPFVENYEYGKSEVLHSDGDVYVVVRILIGGRLDSGRTRLARGTGT